MRNFVQFFIFKRHLSVFVDHPKAISIASKLTFRTRFNSVDINIDNARNNILFNDHLKLISTSSNQVAKLLRIFGGVIQDLKVSQPTTLVSQYINKYQRDSLFKLKMDFIDVDTFASFEKPFNSIEELSFSCSEDLNVTPGGIRTGKLTLDQIFPNLHRLEAVLSAKNNYSFIIQQFPKLFTL